MILALAAGIMAFRRLPDAFRLVLAEIGLSLGTQALAVYWADHVPKPDNHTLWLYDLYALPDFWLQSATAALLLRAPAARRALGGAVVLQAAVWVLNVRAVGWDGLVNWAFLAGSIVLAAAYLGIAVQLVSGGETGSLLRQPVFLLCLSVILYNCCSIPYVALFNVLNSRHATLFGRLQTLLELLDAVRVLLCGACFLLYFFQRKPAPHRAPG